MGATLQNFINKHVWNFEKRSSTSSDMSISGKFWDFVYGTGLQKVSVRQALAISAVYTALSVRSQTIGSLPINIYKSIGDGNTESLPNHPAYYPLAHEPSNYMSSANMFMTAMLNMDSEGNSFIYIHRNGRFQPKSFEIWESSMVTINLVDGEAFYSYEGRTYPARDVLHFRMFSLDGLHGLSPIRQNQATMGMAKKLDEYVGQALGAKPPGVLSYDGDLTPEQRAQNKEDWNKQDGKIKVMSGNWKFTPTIISPGDAEYIASRKMNKTDIWGIYKIPPVFAQDYERATFANAEQSDLIYTKHTVIPIVTMIEKECNMKLFTEAEKATTFMKMNVNGLLRGDLKSRAEFYTSMRNTGSMDGNEIRSLEDMNSYKGGDIKVVQGGMIPVDQLRKFWESKSTAQPIGDGSAKRDAYEFNEVIN